MLNYLDIIILLAISLFLAIHGIVSLWQMFYGWISPEKINKNKMPRVIYPPLTFFSLVIPARHEENVIAETLIQLNKQDYPKSLFEVLVPMMSDDINTILEVEKVKKKYPEINIKPVIFSDGPINKPHGLNKALKETKGDYVAVFDAEDQILPKLLSAVNNLIVSEKREIIQIGVSLINWHSNWFSLHSVLEYYFWFNSRLHWYCDKGIVPLAGVGIFLPKECLVKINGWNENCLTEDADLGIKCSIKNYPVRIICDKEYLIQEEVPLKFNTFLKQRTRWIQGFLQIIINGSWKKLSFMKQIYFLTLFTFPVIHLSIYIWALISIKVFSELPILVTLLSYLPLMLLFFQMMIHIAGIINILSLRKQTHLILLAISLFVFTYFPYQILMVFCTLRALVREFSGNVSWEKTTHFNLNRNLTNFALK